jgi:DNA-binding NarL/FixJ family response regulator
MNIYLIDGHPLIREALGIQIRRLAPTATIHEAGNLGEFAVQSATQGTPDLIVTELALSDSSGLSSIAQLKALHPRCPLIIFTQGSAALLEDAAIQAGADIFIQKTTSINDLSSALRAIVAADTTVDTQTGDGTKKLSRRQKELMLMLNQGLSNRDISGKMDISEHTVKVHLWRLFRKLSVNSRTQALAFGRANGLV